MREQIQILDILIEFKKKNPTVRKFGKKFIWVEKKSMNTF